MLLECQRRGGASGHALGGHLTQGCVQGTVKRHTEANVEAAAHKRQPQRLARRQGDLDAQPAVDALARLVDHLRVLEILHQPGTLAAIAVRVGTVLGGVAPQLAGVQRPAVAVRAAPGLPGGFVLGEPGRRVGRWLVARRLPGAGDFAS